MARLKCAECGASVGRADVVCRRCGRSLLEDGSVVEVPGVREPGVREPGVREPGVRKHPYVDQPR